MPEVQVNGSGVDVEVAEAVVNPRTRPTGQFMARCGNSTAVNSQICCNVWRNIPEGSGVGLGTWKALQLYWRHTFGTKPPAEWRLVVINWPPDQLRWLRGTLVQYTCSEGVHLRIADIKAVNTFDTTHDWSMEMLIHHSDREIHVTLCWPWNPKTGDVIWPS